jgi:hypothetical protein
MLSDCLPRVFTSTNIVFTTLLMPPFSLCSIQDFQDIVTLDIEVPAMIVNLTVGASQHVPHQNPSWINVHCRQLAMAGTL